MKKITDALDKLSIDIDTLNGQQGLTAATIVAMRNTQTEQRLMQSIIAASAQLDKALLAPLIAPSQLLKHLPQIRREQDPFNYAEANMAKGYFGDMAIVINPALTITKTDWTPCRSPARAMRRAARGFKQNCVTKTIPDPSVYNFNGKFVMHPATRAKIIDQLEKGIRNLGGFNATSPI